MSLSVASTRQHPQHLVPVVLQLGIVSARHQCCLAAQLLRGHQIIGVCTLSVESCVWGYNGSIASSYRQGKHHPVASSREALVYM
jgi:hypothetical protein